MTHERDANQRITAIVKTANREARDCLNENTLKIKEENHKLRTELLKLINETKDFSKHKEKLVAQKEDLLKELKYAEDLKKLRSTQQKRVMEKLFPDDIFDS